LQTQNLLDEGLFIRYVYELERLDSIVYPIFDENNVNYDYGASGADNNTAGRITIQTDATGSQEFEYGPLGEITKNTRSIQIPDQIDRTYITQWEYDTWNRLTSITYPDGEEVHYNYNPGGLLDNVYGDKLGTEYPYVNELGYDQFEQRVYLQYGNGTETTYDYEDDRRRLETLAAPTHPV